MTITTFIDYVASLAILALLAESYGILRRRLFGVMLAPVVIGALFGVMAVVQMMRPLTPFDGLIIDMRNIPIALAGAFLGWRGLLPCLAIAIGARFGIGGVGAEAGVAGMVIAGLAGVIWARQMRNYEARNFGMLMCLALVMSSHLFAAVILPYEMAVWFYTSAAAPVLALNLMAIPLIGSLLERENRRIRREKRVKDVMSKDPTSGLLTGPAFVRDITSAFAAQPFGMFAGLLVVRQERNVIQRALGLRSISDDRLAVFCSVVKEHLEHYSLAGVTDDGSIFVPLTEEEVGRASTLSRSLQIAIDRAEVSTPIQRFLSDGIDLTVVSTPDPAVFLRLAERAALSPEPDWLHQMKRRDKTPRAPRTASMFRRSSIFDPKQHNSLFAKADYLMERNN